ncbi:M15 family metallopeptidase [Microbacterium sp. NPDC058269]|uniref:M15 family metallopeptidase n=1 Tax=Microbacterium sp. NPDC058269 TaxID=3346414 RepID=UPI0036DE8C00
METTSLSNGRGWLRADAAASLARVDVEIGHPLQITESGRTYAQQKAHWDHYQKYGKPIANRPGTSLHESGLAIDTDERRTEVLNRHGWFHTVYRWVNGKYTLVEPWHYEYSAGRDRYIGQPATGGTTTPPPATPTPSWEDDMPTFITSDGGQSLEIGGYIIPLANAEEVGSIQITPGKLVCSKVVHARINAIVGGRKSEDVIVNVLGGDGTRYVWAGGILTPIAYQQTVDQLIAMGAGAVDWPLAEVERILAKQG